MWETAWPSKSRGLCGHYSTLTTQPVPLQSRSLALASDPCLPLYPSCPPHFLAPDFFLPRCPIFLACPSSRSLQAGSFLGCEPCFNVAASCLRTPYCFHCSGLSGVFLTRLYISGNTGICQFVTTSHPGPSRQALSGHSLNEGSDVSYLKFKWRSALCADSGS